MSTTLSPEYQTQKKVPQKLEKEKIEAYLNLVDAVQKNVTKPENPPEEITSAQILVSFHKDSSRGLKATGERKEKSDSAKKHPPQP